MDLDWEWPGAPDWAQEVGNTVDEHKDAANFLAFVKELRTQLNALTARTGSPYQISAFLPASPTVITAGGWNAADLFQYLDYGNLQGYDLWGSWADTTGYQGNIHGDSAHNWNLGLDTIVASYTDAGVDPAQAEPRHPRIRPGVEGCHGPAVGAGYRHPPAVLGRAEGSEAPDPSRLHRRGRLQRDVGIRPRHEGVLVVRRPVRGGREDDLGDRAGTRRHRLLGPRPGCRRQPVVGRGDRAAPRRPRPGERLAGCALPEHAGCGIPRLERADHVSLR
ncbi:glycosyl hydrolase family 18 protein [Microbacterium elymi]|uniref:chitinase n=1 Tax=Microbacterium elymi TaxID=2909587 RepID=A0ABY5NNK2_9MICO|nr:glycosyl hydrolase family 18 protein [Microbacterium elymi]UUT36626.1 glycosyl hydrolase family 18 protein [Microbacterium elymi]